ncbi:hypothetical protein [Chryseobacterium sp. GP-SGM7]|uniref:hypothetical protein n=1 Tax=Chryseobacterium sp. GP-SGM7 TaxID=3411323 RepID=UPI003B9550CF
MRNKVREMQIAIVQNGKIVLSQYYGIDNQQYNFTVKTGYKNKADEMCRISIESNP